MSPSLKPEDFKGTTIKTAFEQMRANAILNAENNVRGMSIINFNVACFLGKHRHNDALFIFAHWAIQPIKKDSERFKRNPIEGQDALKLRANQLTTHLSQREDISEEFSQTLLHHMKNVIAKEISKLKALQTA